MGHSVYDFSDYRKYLREALSARGHRSRLASTLGCGTSYITQVLRESVHLSLEQAFRTSDFLEHSKDQRNYFLLMVQYGKAGSQALAGHFFSQMEVIRKKKQEIGERLEIRKSLSIEDQAYYYRNWQLSAIHVLLSVPEYRTPKAISEYLGLSKSVVQAALEYLVSIQLAKQVNHQFVIGENRIHLGKDSPLISKHHANWRLQALNAIDTPRPEDLHFSSVMAIARKDIPKIHSLLLSFLQDSDKIIGPSPEEELCCLNIDWFHLKKHV